MLSAAELDCIYATVAASLDVSLTLTRDTNTRDTYGHQKPASTTASTIQVNVINPSAGQLQIFADKIGSQRALILRAMQDTDIREGDHIAYDGLSWLVNGVMNAQSFSVTKKYLITVVT